MFWLKCPAAPWFSAQVHGSHYKLDRLKLQTLHLSSCIYKQFNLIKSMLQLIYRNSNFKLTFWTKLSKKDTFHHIVQKVMDLLRLRSGHWAINPWGMTSNCTSCIIPYVWKIKIKKKTLLSSIQVMFNSQVHEGKHSRIDLPKSLSKIFLNTLFWLQNKG